MLVRLLVSAMMAFTVCPVLASANRAPTAKNWSAPDDAATRQNVERYLLVILARDGPLDMFSLDFKFGKGGRVESLALSTGCCARFTAHQRLLAPHGPQMAFNPSAPDHRLRRIEWPG